MTHAGPEIGVASTKAFTTQLVSLALLLCSIGKLKNTINKKQEREIIDGLKKLPGLINEALTQENQIKKLANRFIDKNSALFIGRGTMHAIAMEGALKIKEISYIHAEAYPAGELKHGPIALIDKDMPVVFLAPQDETFLKILSNIEEVKARGGIIITVTDEENDSLNSLSDYVLVTPKSHRYIFPITSSIILQLLAYELAQFRGCEIDQPRNLAKSVTVE